MKRRENIKLMTPRRRTDGASSPSLCLERGERSLADVGVSQQKEMIKMKYDMKRETAIIYSPRAHLRCALPLSTRREGQTPELSGVGVSQQKEK